MVCCSCFGIRPRLNKSSRNSSSSSAHPARPLSVSETPQSHQTQIFTYRELAIATNSFRPNSLIGRGGFGAVFKGVLQTTGQNVAVKVLDTTGFQGDKEFLVEVLMLSLLRHQNLVKLIGYCAEGDQRMVVYEYMPLGSVEDHIHNGQEALDWNTRMQIAAGAAKGLEYLHNQASPPVIYRDLKTANILLDHDYNAKLSDFGLAKFGPTGDMSHVSTRIMGTRGYCAPEYANTGKLTMKSDIYSFGVVMLELITGRKAMLGSYGGRDCYLVNWARPLFMVDNIKRIVDPVLPIRGRYMEATLRKALEVAFMCLREDANARPSISEVVVALNYIVKCTAKIQKKLSSGQGDSGRKGEKSSPKETSRMLNKNEEDEEVNRGKAVDEAKFWARKWVDVQSEDKQLPSRSP